METFFDILTILGTIILCVLLWIGFLGIPNSEPPTTNVSITFEIKDEEEKEEFIKRFLQFLKQSMNKG